MAPYNRRMQMQRRPEAEVVHIDPPKPPEHKPLPPRHVPQTRKLFPSEFAAEDWLLMGLMMLFLQSDQEEYAMMLPALIYIFLG